MNLFLKYIMQYRRTAGLFLLFSSIFAIVLLLYDSSVEAVGYAFVLCTVIGSIFTILGFLRFKKRHVLLKQIYENIPLMLEHLPPADGIAEADLQAIIAKLHTLNGEKLHALNAIRHDNVDYFTVWVHQMKTPISAMQMLLQTEDTDTSRALSAELFRIEQYAEMALHYIRLDSEVNDLVLQRYDLDRILKQAIHRYAPSFIHRKIRLDYQPVHANVLTDEKWLIFVVEQLLSNAVKYTVKGCVTIRFTNQRLSVSDTGIGIAPEDLPRIFEKGYTGMSGRAHQKSTGLGLYLCKQVCDKLGYRMDAVSEVGIGTTITIDLSKPAIAIE